jgi:hypothetical protein
MLTLLSGSHGPWEVSHFEQHFVPLFSMIQVTEIPRSSSPLQICGCSHATDGKSRPRPPIIMCLCWPRTESLSLVGPRSTFVWRIQAQTNVWAKFIPPFTVSPRRPQRCNYILMYCFTLDEDQSSCFFRNPKLKPQIRTSGQAG